jgi:serine/threonine-protein kinase
MLDALEGRNSSFPAVAVAAVPPTMASVPPVANGVPVTTVSTPPPNYQAQTVFSPSTVQPGDTTRSSGMGDWQKAIVIGGIIGAFVLIGLWITRPQPTPINDTASEETDNSGTSPNPETSSNFAPVPSQPTPSITSQEAITLIDNWLGAKARIFGRSYDRQLAGRLTTGERYRTTIGSIDWLQNNNAYYEYFSYNVQPKRDVFVSGTEANIEVNVTEDLILYVNGQVDPNQTTFGPKTQSYRFFFEWVGDSWKISKVQS